MTCVNRVMRFSIISDDGHYTLAFVFCVGKGKNIFLHCQVIFPFSNAYFFYLWPGDCLVRVVWSWMPVDRLFSHDE